LARGFPLPRSRLSPSILLPSVRKGLPRRHLHTDARTGQIGDGEIFIPDLAECIRIRTGETGGVAIG